MDKDASLEANVELRNDVELVRSVSEKHLDVIRYLKSEDENFMLKQKMEEWDRMFRRLMIDGSMRMPSSSPPREEENNNNDQNSNAADGS